MAFPNVIIECAFDNDVNEYLYAQTGYADISPWVRSISGDLRGRRYEMDSIESGSLQFTLDNSEGFFTPGSEQSPFYPNVKPARRIRVRGNNKQRMNIATTGSALRSTRGFNRAIAGNYTFGYTPGGTYVPLAIDPVLVANSGLTSAFRTLLHTNEVPDPNTTALTKWGGSNTTLSQVGDGWHRSTLTTTTTGYVYPAPQSTLRYATTNGSRLMSRVRVRGHATKTMFVRLEHALYDNTNASITGGTNGAYIEIPPNEEVVVTYVSTANNAATAGWLPLLRIAGTISGGATVIGDYVDHTQWYVEDGTTAPTGDYFFAGDTAESANADGTVHGYLWSGTANASVSQEYSRPVLSTHHIEVTVPSGTAAGEYGLVSWNVPIELGRRLTHSAYIWKVSGTEPGTNLARLIVTYYDANGTALTRIPDASWALPNPTTPTQRVVNHTPPVGAAYATCTLYMNYSAATTTNITYGIEGIQTNNSPSLLPSPPAWDADWWFVTGPNSTVPVLNTTDLAIEAVMGASGDSELYTYVTGLIPGEQYTATIELRHFTAALTTPTTSLRLTADDGQTGTTVTGQGAYSTAVLTFTAKSATQKLAIQMSDGSDFLSGWVVRARKGTVVPGTSSGGLYVYGVAPFDVMPWEPPNPIFEGWVEAWPLRVDNSANEITVTANDRLSRIGNITLQSTWREALFADGMDLIIPFDDDPIDAAGKVAQIGRWASLNQIIELSFGATRGDLAASSYVLGVDGPTDETAIEFNPAAYNTGYFVPVPYSKDYTTPATPPPPPPTTKPPATVPTYTTQTFTKTYYATWSRTYEGNNATTWDDSALMYQGYFSGTRGNTRSMAGFNYSAIKSDLVGATIKTCKVTFMNEETWSFGGSSIYVGTHTNSAKPSTFVNASPRRVAAVKHAYGANTVTVNLGVTIGNEFKAGTTKGVVVGPAPSNDHIYYAKYRGATQTGRPYLTITFTKQVKV